MARMLVTRTLRIRRVRRVVEAQGAPTIPCGVCGRDVRSVTLAEAVELLRCDDTSLPELVEEGRVHLVPTTGDAVWICRDSIFRRNP